MFKYCKLMLALFLACFFSMAYRVLANPPRDEFFAQGVASVQGMEDPARLEALQDFKKQAVLQAILQLAGPDAVVAHKKTIDSEVLCHADDFVESFRIINEGNMEGLYRVNGVAKVLLHDLEQALKESGIIGEEEGKDGMRPEAETARNLIHWLSLQGCSADVSGRTAQSFFDDILKQKLSERGWAVSEDETAEAKWVVKSLVECSNGIIVAKVEVRSASDESVKGVVSESVMSDSETPLMESLLTLVEVVYPQLMDIIDRIVPTSKVFTSSSVAESDRNTWNVVIEDCAEFSCWEKLEGALHTKGLKGRVQEIVIDRNSVNVRLAGVPDSLPDYVENLNVGSGLKVTIDKLDPVERNLSLMFQSAGSQ